MLFPIRKEMNELDRPKIFADLIDLQVETLQRHTCFMTEKSPVDSADTPHLKAIRNRCKQVEAELSFLEQDILEKFRNQVDWEGLAQLPTDPRSQAMAPTPLVEAALEKLPGYTGKYVHFEPTRSNIAEPPRCGRWLLTSGRPRNPLRHRAGQKSLKDALAEIGSSARREDTSSDFQLAVQENKDKRGWFLEQQVQMVQLRSKQLNERAADINERLRAVQEAPSRRLGPRNRQAPVSAAHSLNFQERQRASSHGGGLFGSAAAPSAGGLFGSPSSGASSGGGGLFGSSAAPAPASGAVDVKQAYKDRMIKIYQQHNPGKVNEIDSLMAKYVGQEHTMYLKICKKYNVQPEPEIKADGGAAGGLFGSAAAPSAGGLFGSPSSGASPFGGASGFSSGGFGFGSPASGPSPSGFGSGFGSGAAGPAGPFGGASCGACGACGAPAGGLFGSSASSSPFGAASASPFGSASASPFGSGVGMGAAASSGGLFGSGMGGGGFGGAAAPAGGLDVRQAYKERMIKIYMQHNPSKEHTMYLKICNKYKVQPEPEIRPGGQCGGGLFGQAGGPLGGSMTGNGGMGGGGFGALAQQTGSAFGGGATASPFAAAGASPSPFGGQAASPFGGGAQPCQPCQPCQPSPFGASPFGGQATASPFGASPFAGSQWTQHRG
eukprot:g5115.t1